MIGLSILMLYNSSLDSPHKIKFIKVYGFTLNANNSPLMYPMALNVRELHGPGSGLFVGRGTSGFLVGLPPAPGSGLLPGE